MTDTGNRNRSDRKPRPLSGEVAAPGEAARFSHHAHTHALVSYHVTIRLRINRRVHIQKATCGRFVRSQPASRKEVQDDLRFTSIVQRRWEHSSRRR